MHSCCGPIDGFGDSYADFSTVGFSGAAATGYFAGFLYRSRQLGARPETSALAPQWAGTPGWSAAHKLSGLAAEGWSLKFDKDGKRFAGGVPAFGSIVRGVRAYDPRLDSTYPGGSGPQRIADEATWAYTRNPALHALAYAYGRHVNGKKMFGVDLGESGIVLPPFVAWANVCDANAWTVNGTIYEPGDKWNNLKRICEAGSAEPMFVGGALTVRFDAPKVSLDTIDFDDLAGDISAPAMRPWKERLNTVVPRYRSPVHQWEYVAADAVVDTAAVAQDGETKSDERQLDLVTNTAQAAVLAGYAVGNARETGPIVLPCKPRMIEYHGGDCLTLSARLAAALAMPNPKVVVTQREIDVATGIVTLTCVTETYAKHVFALGQAGIVPPIVDVPSPATIDGVVYDNGAVAALAALSSDNVLSAGSDKGTLLLLRDTAAARQLSLNRRSSDLIFSLGSDPTYTERLASDTAMVTIDAYLDSLTPSWRDINSDSPIDGAHLRDLFATFDTTAGTLERALATVTNNAIAAAAADNVLSRGEKPALMREFDSIVAEVPQYAGQADVVAVDHAAYSNAYTALYDYLSGLAPLWYDTSVDTPINGAALLVKSQAYYAARADLQKRITAAVAAAASTEPPRAAISLRSRTPQYPLTSDASAIYVEAFTGLLDTGDTVSFPASTVSGLNSNSSYVVSQPRDGGAYVATPSPALAVLASSANVIIGEQYTSYEGGGYREPPEPPGGTGGGRFYDTTYL